MDRRQVSGSNAGQHLMRPNSFIPTANQNGGAKLGPLQIQQIAFQSQLQAQSHSHIQIPQHHPTNNFYQNMPSNQSQQSQSQHPPTSNNNRFSHGTLPRNAVIPEPQYGTHPHQQINNSNRTLTKSFSSHYGTTGMNNQHQQNGGNPLYGNLMGGVNGRQLGNVQASIPQPPQQVQHRDPGLIHTSNLPPPIQIQPVINQIQQQHHSNKILQHFPTSDGDGLPPTLVDSMRTLFDILDDTKEGRVRLSDIESRWENSEASGGSNKGNTGAEPLIKMGVMGYLRKVTPPDGMLTFDRFCSGLRLALITNNNNQSSTYGTSIPQSLYVKNVTNNYYNHGNNPSNSILSSNIQRPTSLPINTNHNLNQSTIQRTSRIPGLSTPSKLPVGNVSGIPVSPKNKLPSTLSYGANQIGLNATQATARRIPLNQSQHAEQGTTVAIVHQQPPPPPNPKPTANGIPIYNNRSNEIQIGTIKFTKPSLITPPNGGFTKNGRYSSKNGSLDNLKSDNEEKSEMTVGKLRPPSAPILDTTDDDDGAEHYTNRSSNKRERARSRDRDIEENKRNGGNRRGKSSTEELSFGKRVVSFVTPRQRTLSMPQLQLNKLKSSKSIQLDDDSSPSPSSSSHSPLSSGETKQGALKSSLKASNQSSGIPTKMQKQKSEVITNGRKDDIRTGINGTPLSFKENKIESLNNDSVQSAPPKPPRNSNGLSVTLPHGVQPGSDPPLSGSSNASIPSKPEIRQFLQSWKLGVSEKRQEEKNNLPQKIPDNSNNISTQENQNGSVKLREKKGNVRRRETARRHTVQSGIDFATLKRLKQLEQERDVLQQGMSSLENAKGWYTKQMDIVDEKIGLLTKGAPITDNWSESLEERLNLLSCRISEVNSLLAVLMDGSSKIPNHMNLQIPSHMSFQTITRLKEQNRQLTQEVSDCSHRVTQLETEKAMLLRQLFAKNNLNHSEETIYM